MAYRSRASVSAARRIGIGRRGAEGGLGETVRRERRVHRGVCCEGPRRPGGGVGVPRSFDSRIRCPGR